MIQLAFRFPQQFQHNRVLNFILLGFSQVTIGALAAFKSTLFSNTSRATPLIAFVTLVKKGYGFFAPAPSTDRHVEY